MNPQNFPQGWDAERVSRLISEYDNLSDDELATEDETASEDHDGQTLISVPEALLPAIRELIATYKASA